MSRRTETPAVVKAATSLVFLLNFNCENFNEVDGFIIFVQIQCIGVGHIESTGMGES
jgi:hypothetical protein